MFRQCSIWIWHAYPCATDETANKPTNDNILIYRFIEPPNEQKRGAAASTPLNYSLYESNISTLLFLP